MAEENPAAMRRWRNIIGVLILGLVIFAFWAFGTMRVMGLPGFSTTTDVDAKIQAAIGPILTEQRKQGETLTFVSDQVRESLSESKASELRGLALKRCQEKDAAVREAFNREIDRKQAEYFGLKSHYYSVPSCGEL